MRGHATGGGVGGNWVDGGSWKVDQILSCLHWQGYFQEKKSQRVEVCHWKALKNESCSPGPLQLWSSAADFLATW